MAWHVNVNTLRKIDVRQVDDCTATCPLDLAILGASRNAFGRGTAIDHEMHFSTYDRARAYAAGLVDVDRQQERR